MIERVEKNEHGGQRAGKVTLSIPSCSEWPVLHLGEEVTKLHQNGAAHLDPP